MRKSSIAEKGNRARKSTSFQVPLLDENLNLIEDSYLNDSNDYITDFIEFKKKLEKRKKSTSSRRNSVNSNVDNLKGSANSTSTFANNMNNNTNNSSNKIISASESKFRPVTPKVFNYFPHIAKNNGHSSDSNIHSNKSVSLFNQKLPGISSIQQNLLTSRISNNNNVCTDVPKNGNGYKNLFFPILIRNYPNKNETYKSQNFVNNFKNYLDESSGIFWIHSLSHLKPKNVN